MLKERTWHSGDTGKPETYKRYYRSFTALNCNNQFSAAILNLEYMEIQQEKLNVDMAIKK